MRKMCEPTRPSVLGWPGGTFVLDAWGDMLETMIADTWPVRLK